MPNARDFVAQARTMLGYPYTTRRPVVCSATDRGVDCSGLIVCAARKVGLTNVATNSSALARSMQAAGTLLPLSKVGTVVGGLLIRGPNSGYWGYGPLGHVGIDVGDGVRTFEIGSVRQPAHYGLIAGWRPSNYGMLPGLDYSAPAPNPPPIGGHVVPQFNPPVAIVSICRFHHPTLGGCAAMLGTDGGVFCDPPEAYLGGVNGAAAFVGRTPARIEVPTPDEAATGKSYVIVATSGERYRF